jgi:tight adherence protein C
MEPTTIIVAAIIIIAVVACMILMLRAPGGQSEDRWSAGGRSTQKSAAIESAMPTTRRKQAQGPQGPSAFGRMFAPLGAVLRLSDSTASQVQEMLVHAGIRDKISLHIFMGAKLALALAMPALVVVGWLWFRHTTGKPIDMRHVFMSGAFALALGLIAPNVWLRGKASTRIRKIRLSLPDALDLLIVCIEAGLGMDAALVRISQEMTESAPEFSEELILLNLEIAAGKPRIECLRNMALRTGCDEVEALVARINQSIKYGTNLGHSLRIHSDSLRVKRRQDAEERAAKTAIKLLFPLVFFIFPAIFVVILGPGLVTVLEMMRS